MPNSKILKVLELVPTFGRDLSLLDNLKIVLDKNLVKNSSKLSNCQVLLAKVLGNGNRYQKKNGKFL